MHLSVIRQQEFEGMLPHINTTAGERARWTLYLGLIALELRVLTRLLAEKFEAPATPKPKRRVRKKAKR